MPPKGSRKELSEEGELIHWESDEVWSNAPSKDYRYNEERTHVQCRVCSDGVAPELCKWITVRSVQLSHLTSGPHLRAVELAENAKRREEILAKEKAADAATEELREIQFTSRRVDGPLAGASSRVMSEAEADMWADYRINGANFSAGDDVEDPEARHRQLREEAECFGLWNPEAMARKLGFGDADAAEIMEEDEEDDFLAEIFRDSGIQEPEPEEIENADDNLKSNEWYPYPTKMLMRAILWILKEANCKDVPSFDRLRRVQKGLRARCGIPSIPCKSVQGNVFFMNDPKAIIAQVSRLAISVCHSEVNPCISRNSLEIPEDGVIREIWHAQKWRKNMDLDILSPMYDAGASHYYVNEISQLRNGKFIIPIRWVKFRGKVYADSFAVSLSHQDLTSNYYDLERAGKIPKWEASSIRAGHPARMPNQKRIIAAGRPMYSSFVNYFSDDVSGNRTKSWNKHWNAYMTHQNLPRKLLQQEFHVHFISTSPNASASEQFHEFKAAVEVTHTNPVEVQDELGSTTCLSIYVNAAPSDNPMQSEVCAHIGGKGNCFCRKCQAGGTQKKATNEGYHTLFEVFIYYYSEFSALKRAHQAGVPRTKEKILEELEKQVQLACSGVAKHVKDSQTETGVKDVYTQFWIDELISRFKEMRKDHPNRSAQEVQEELIQWTVDNRDKIYSPFLTMKGFDPTKDTPLELLHTILLGVVKYIWHVTHTPLSLEEKQTYAVRLQSTDTDGLSIHAIRSAYIMQYAGSLIGRQFKTIAQTNIFHVRGLVTEDQFQAWKAAGELAALLWFPEIRDLAEYRADLRVAVANVLDIFATIDPSKIITKIKYHLLVHTDEDVLQFGPLIGVITEGFESYNGVFRYCSILSNHLAPSRDIAIQLGDQEGLKHRLTGGWWPSSEGGEWERAGSGVRHFMAKHPVLQKLLGWTEEKSIKHGIAHTMAYEITMTDLILITGDSKLTSLKRGQKERPSHSLASTSAAHALNFGLYSPDSMWRKCVYVISESLDECFVNSWVFAKSPMAEDSSTISGRISDILVDSTGVVVAVLEKFQILSCRDEVYGMPVLSIKFKFNVQHDCNSAKCEATGVRLRMQERVQSDRTEKYIVHNSLDRFIINTHAFHNAHLLRATLPRNLVAPIPLFPDRQTKHHELASQLRQTLTSRKEIAAAKKRKRAEGDSGGEHEGRSRKTRKISKGQKKKSGDVPSAESMVANRERRKITRTRRARATPELDSDEEDLADDSDEGYDDFEHDSSD
ncbi:hypothetical protein B0H11DRAFT_2376311 [Mycena galericulata]|nr:hypothetical protein B0H11DRAFT_2376311 [Mycena galericulata]